MCFFATDFIINNIFLKISLRGLLETLDRKLINAVSNPLFGDSLTSKTINTPKIFVLCIGMILMLVPAVSAGQGQAVYSGKDVKNPTDAVTYSIVPAGESSPSTGDPRVPLLTTGTLKQGVSYASYLNIGSGIHWLETDLNWGVTSNSLSITIYNPSNNNLGTYSDSSDGKLDGRIHMSIYPSSGYLAQGRWTFTVKGVKVSGTTGQKYTLNFYTH
jgi:hypothetical protein